MNEELQKHFIKKWLKEGKHIGVMLEDFVSIKITRIGKKAWQLQRYFKSEKLNGMTICNSVEEVIEELDPHLPVADYELQSWEGEEK